MASRAANYWRYVVNRPFVTSTAPKMKAMTLTAADVHHGHSHTRRMKMKGDFVPIYAALGAITVSLGLGLHTAKHHLAYDPAVRLNKKRRETIPEVVEPDRVVNEVDRYINKSIYRKVGHVREFESIRVGTRDPTRPNDPLKYPRRVETLKSVGVDPVSL